MTIYRGFDCDFCHHPILEGQKTVVGNHEFCDGEWDKRSHSGKCVVCGKNEQDGFEGDHKCLNCRNKNTDYSGYEGPQS